MTATDPTTGVDASRAIRSVRAGDTAAFADLVRAHERPLRLWLAVRSPPGVDVDEIAQRAFVAAFTRLDEFRLGTDFGAWLFTIARYQLGTETTRLRRVADYHARYAPDVLQRELERRLDETTSDEERRLDHLRHCLDALGEAVRRFATWRYEEEVPLEVMATRSGRSVAAVKKQLFKMRRKLEACVEARLAAEGRAT